MGGGVLLGEEEKPLPRRFEHDDEVLVRIERHAGADQHLVVQIGAAEPGRIENGVGPMGVEAAIGFVDELHVAEREARFEDQVTRRVDFPLSHGAGL